MTSEDDKNLVRTNELRLENIKLKNDLHSIKSEIKISVDQLNDINDKVKFILNLLQGFSNFLTVKLLWTP